MKTSNKILLTVSLIAIGTIAGVHAAFYVKYKSGDYVAVKDMEKENYARHELKPVKYLVVRGVDNLTIIPSDTAYADIQKEGSSRIRFRADGDSLVVSGDTTVTNSDGSTRTERSYANINIYMTSLDVIQASNSSFFLSGRTDSSKALSSEIVLTEGSNMQLSRNNWEDSSARYFGRITIRSGPSSQIVLNEYAVLQSLDLSLNGSGFRDEEAKIGALTISSDSSSTVELHGKNLAHLNLSKE
ncbi:MAG TPA: hypothetical protein VG890_12920 [Puia sp.]|nr:hypothetical protein [Puia sp.]